MTRHARTALARRFLPAATLLALGLFTPPGLAQRPPFGARSGIELPPEPRPDPSCNCLCPPAGTAPAPVQSQDPVTRLAEAKLLFAQGNELRKLGDCARALDFYERSRAIIASVPNTLNHAFCLDQLARHGEAYEAYETLLTEFLAEISPADKAAVVTSMEALRGKLGALQISSNVDGLLVIDGRRRGHLPLSQDVRVKPGERVIRVVKDGWATFEKTVTVDAGETLALDAKLAPLAESGRLRVDDERLVGADVFVDGTLVGQLPWEGSLAPGAHYYSVRRGDIGSAPREANVVRSQVAIATVEAGPLAGDFRILVQPITADLTLNGVPLGKGQWRGRLPVGKHTIEAHEPGYVSYLSRPTFSAENSGELILRLEVDPDHPRWGRKQGTFWLSAFGGYAFADGLQSGAEETCTTFATCPPGERRRAQGGLFGVRGGYEFPVGLSVEVSAGYVLLRTALRREVTATLPPQNGGAPFPTTYSITDNIETVGPFVSVGGSYRHELFPWLFATVSGAFGVAFTETRDELSAEASAGGVTLPIAVDRAGRTLTSPAPFLMPELALGARYGRFYADVGVALFGVLFAGPPHETRGNTIVGQTCSAQTAGTVHCSPSNQKVVSEETSYGPYAAWVPRFAAGLRF